MTTIERPGNDECADYYLQYIRHAPEGDVLALLDEQLPVLADLPNYHLKDLREQYLP